jgi:hypothetical protein
MSGTEPQASRTITQSRLTMSAYFLFSAGILTLGEAYRTGRLVLSQSTKWPGDGVSLGYFVVAVGLWFCAASLSQLIQPARLVIEPHGLTYMGPWWRREWRWADVGEFKIDEMMRGAKCIKFDVIGDRGSTTLKALRKDTRAMINRGWPLPLDEICGELNAARVHWR